MNRLLTSICLAAIACLRLAAATYYVSSSTGNDSNNGTAQVTPWKTLSKVNSTALAPGDTVLLARGDTWRESLVPPASGASASPISFDAYGSGPAPAITGYLDLSSASWTLVSGNIWQTPLSAAGINNVLFATIWGQRQTSQAALLHDRDFYFSAGKLYLYSAGNPATYYVSIAAITTAAGQLIYVNGKSWLRFQHISLNWFDGFGVNITGSSDHLLFANMESNGMVPAGTLPHGFYLNANSPGDISFYNVEAHLNYDGFKFDGTATSITLTNCKAYANRDGGLVDNTGHASYSYSHFYANNIAIFNSQDIQGAAVDAGNNLPVDTPPAVVNFTTYPARVTFTVDDVGFAPATETYIDSLVPLFNARALKLSAAVTTGYASSLVTQIQSWLAAGHDINSHSWSHQYYTNTSAFTIRYIGSGTAAALTITGNRLTTTITGGPGGENLNFDLTQAAYDTASELIAAINSNSAYLAVLDSNCRTAAHTVTLADVTSQDIKSSAYTALFQKDRLEPDELATSKAWLQTNIPGLSTVKTFVYPDGIQDSQTQAWSAAAGYEGARGALSIGLGSNSVYSRGVNIQNITSLSIAGLHALTSSQIDAKIAALTFKASVWGVPYGLFIHLNDLTPAEVAATLDSLLAHGALVMTNTQLMDWLASTSNIAATTNYVSSAPGLRPNFHLTAASPILNAGTNLGSPYQTDLAGLLRPLAQPWDIGAYAHTSATYGTGHGPGVFTIGSPSSCSASSCDLPLPAWAALPATFINTHSADAPYDVTKYAGTICPLNAGACDYATPMAALTAWCSAPDQQWNVKVTHGSVFNIPSGGWNWCSKDGSVNGRPAKYIVFESDAPNPDRTACSHGITDPWVGIADGGYRNPNCDGTLLGQQQEFATVHSDSSYNDKANMWAVTESGSNQTLIGMGTVNSAGYAPSHIVLKDIEAYPSPSNTIGGLYILDVSASCSSLPCAPSYVGIERSYIHGDADEYGVGANIISTTVNFGCAYCWLKNNYIAGDKRDSAEGHAIGLTSAAVGPYKIVGNWVEGQSIGLFSGGSAAGMFDAGGNTLVATDAEIRRNRFTLPLWWGDGSTTYGLRWNSGHINQALSAGVPATITGVTCPKYTLSSGLRMQISTSTTGAGSNQELIVFSAGTNCPANSTGTVVFTPARSWSANAYYLTSGSVGSKNRFEYKSAKRWLVDGNILENSYVDGQQYISIIHPGGGCATSTCNSQNNLGQWVSGTTEGTDTAQTNNIIRHASNGPAWVGRYGGWTLNTANVTSATCVGGTEVDIVHASSTALDDKVPVYVLGASGFTSGDTWYWPVQGTSTATAINLQANCSGAASAASVTGRTGTTGGNMSARQLHQVFQNNLLYDIGDFAKWDGSGQSNMAATGANGNNYAFTATRSNGIVTATITAMGEWPLPRSAQAPAYPNGPPPLMSGISTGDLVYAQCPADPTLATGAAGTMGVPATFSDPAGTVVQYPAAGPDITSPVTCPLVPWAGSTGPSGLYNLQGGSRFFWWNHITAVGTGTLLIGSTGSNATFQQNTTFANTLQLQEPSASSGGFQVSGHTEGSSSITSAYDANTLDFHDWALTYRAASKYAGIGSNLWFPTANSCSGATGDTACIGMKHFLNGTAFDINSSDYHNYALDSSSVYATGQARQASDGKDNGVLLNLIDNALTRRQYVCPQGSACYGKSCGSGSPCPD